MPPNIHMKTSWHIVQTLPSAFQDYIRGIYQGPARLNVRIALSQWLDRLDWKKLSTWTVFDGKPSWIISEFLCKLRLAIAHERDPRIRTSLAEALNAQSTSSAEAVLVSLLATYRYERQIIKWYRKWLKWKGECMIRLLFSPQSNFYDLTKTDEQHDRELSGIWSALGLSSDGDHDRGVSEYQELLKLRSSTESPEEIENYERKLVKLWDAALLGESDSRHFTRALGASIGTLEVVTCIFGRWFSKRLLQIQHTSVHLAYNLPVRDVGLDRIQAFRESLIDSALRKVELLVRLYALVDVVPTPQMGVWSRVPSFLNTQMKALMTGLIRGSFVIEQNPPQIIRTSTKIQTQVRLLVGDKLDITDDQPIVTVYLLRASEGINARRRQPEALRSCSRMKNNSAPLCYHTERRALLATFDQMFLKAETLFDSTSNINPEEQFWLFYETAVNVGDGKIELQTVSLPIVVISDDHQLPLATATIFWSNSFSDPVKAPFVIPDRVPWYDMAETLSFTFRRHTGTALTEDASHFLATKVFRDRDIEFGTGDQEVTWKQFAKEPLPKVDFTFWEWYLAILHLCREKLGRLWPELVVWGFNSQEYTNLLLLEATSGTFILRFSETELGAVAIFWVQDAEDDEDKGRKEIIGMEPFIAGDFDARDVLEKISEAEELRFSYPATPKEELIRKYIPTFKAEPSEYVNSERQQDLGSSAAGPSKVSEQPRKRAAESSQGSSSSTEADAIVPETAKAPKRVKHLRKDIEEDSD